MQNMFSLQVQSFLSWFPFSLCQQRSHHVETRRGEEKIFSVQTIKIFYESNQKYFLKQYFVEVEILVCGAPTMDLSELRKVVVYDGYRPGDETIQHFWEVTHSTLNPEQFSIKLFYFPPGSAELQ